MTEPQTATLQQIRSIAERVAASEGCELVDAEYRGSGGRSLVRIYIDKPGGVTHADCEIVSRQVGTILDVEDCISKSYVLEVSSPGLDRKLLKPADYKRFLGRKAKVKLSRPVGERSQFTGRLSGYQDGEITLDLDGKSVVRFPFEDIERARLVVEI